VERTTALISGVQGKIASGAADCQEVLWEMVSHGAEGREVPNLAQVPHRVRHPQFRVTHKRFIFKYLLGSKKCCAIN
jgi:hypothetical protein